MVTTIRSRPTHYELLGLAAAASGDEIASAFAREAGMFRARPLGGVAQLSVAYETLRDPVKRRAYDLSIGLAPEPLVRPAPTALQIGGRFIGSGVGRPAAIPERAPVPAPAAVAPQPRPEPRATRPIPPRVRPQTPDLRLGDADDRPVDWKRPAIIVGALVGAVSLAGVLAGVSAGGAVEASQQPGPSVKLALPHAKAAVQAAPAAASDSIGFGEQPRRVTRQAIARTKPAPPAPQFTVSGEQVAEAAQVVDQPVEDSATTETVAASAPVETAAALPLSNAVIARTIERIGYTCGEVASTAAAGAGSYKVTCTSGQSYQASPVRGRYHFRRLGGH